MEVPALSTESTPTRRGWYAARALGNRTLFHTVMVLISLVYVVPLVWMVLSSFKTKREIFDSPFALPTNIDLGVWVEAWDRGNLGQYVVNSLITTTASVSAILLFGLAAAYAFSRFRFRFSVVLLAHFVLGLLLPVQSYLTAQSRIFDAFYLLNTRWALIVPYIGLGLALAVFLLKAYLDSMPKELFEAARMDGAADLRMLFQIVLPLMTPGLATVAVFSILSTWNEFLLALLYVIDDDLRTIPAGLLAFTGRYSTDYPSLFAALSIITIPMIAIYVIFHRQVISGVTEGSIQ
ncbi:MAG: sugar permease [Leifsonia sp.]|nr:sugar permease [Leifsonia sp.]|tara:strand:+ start:5244 stop:6122 length:879 start_codon:yes stop_codon:yes gene_type:complete